MILCRIRNRSRSVTSDSDLTKKGLRLRNPGCKVPVKIYSSCVFLYGSRYRYRVPATAYPGRGGGYPSGGSSSPTLP